jgi:hypothetical protein
MVPIMTGCGIPSLCISRYSDAYDFRVDPYDPPA